MTNVVYFAGGEDTSGVSTGAAVITTAGTFRSAYSRCALSVLPTVADPSATRFTMTNWSSALSSFWFHATIQCSGITTTANCPILAFTDGSTVRLLLRGTGTTGQFKISTRNNAGTFVDLATSASGVIADTNTHQLDIFVNYAVSGQMTVYWDGVSVLDTGAGVDVTTNGATTLSGGYLGGISSAGNTRWSEFLVMDSDTRGAGVWTLTPAAAGNTQSWTPNTVGNINEITTSDATFISTTSNNALSQWTTPTSPPAGTWLLLAVVEEARVEKGATGPTQFEWLVRTADGSDHVASTTALTTSFANYTHVWTQNPHTSAAWDISDITTGFNIGIESVT